MKRLFSRKCNFFILVLLAFTDFMSAQKLEVGKVSVDELRQTQHPLYPDAPAAVLFCKGHSYMKYNEKEGFYLVHEISMRMKIYRKEGLPYANYDIPFYVGYKELDKDQLVINDITTYHLKGEKVEKTKGGGEAKIVERINENWKKATIVFPNVTEGSVVEFRYELRSQNLFEFPEFIIQRDIPVNVVEYTTDLPNMYVYKVLTSGFIDIKTEAKYIDGHQNYEDKHGQTRFMNYNQLHTVYSAHNVPPLVEETYVDNMENYRGKITHELEVVRFDGEPDKDFSRTWEGVVKRIYKDRNFGEQLNVTDYFMTDLHRLVDDTDDTTVRMNRVFAFLRDRMNWDGKFQFWTDRKLAEAYSERTGSSGEINLILCAMLRMAGIEANPVLLSTVKNGIAVYPNVTAFNHIIVAADSGGKRWLLDATDKHTVPGILPLRDLNWEGRLVRAYGDSESVNLQPSEVSRTNVNVVAEVLADGTVTAKVSARKTDYDALVFRTQTDRVLPEHLVREKEREIGAVTISNYRIEEGKNGTDPIGEFYDVSSTSVADVVGDRLYLNPLLFFHTENNPFTDKDRHYPIFFGHPRQYRITLSVHAPDGYVVESVPPPTALATGEGVASFKLTAQQNGNLVQILMSLETNRMLVAADFYPILREFYARMIASQQQKIILKKA
ncbi:MAG TPA: transglutaminase domain-containing protein [Flavobacterium sp.]|nr:transglutaminase domain-containing protein [Flavobacterium sp.]